jgi:rhodanese-related sulfurtransferase
MRAGIIITALLVSFLSASGQVVDSIKVVDPDKLMLELAVDPTTVLIDVRMPMEFRKGRIEKAVNIPSRQELNLFASAKPASIPIYLYCTTETRSRQAARYLIEKGFTNVSVLEGGLKKWKSYNLPIVKGKVKKSA